MALSAATVVGTAIPASAAPSQDPLAPITAFAAGAAVGDIAAPEGMTVQALIAAHNAGFPIYEAVAEHTYRGTYKTPDFQMIEYRRVYDINALSSPTAKFETVGTEAPDTFFDNPDSVDTMRVNPRVVTKENITGPFTTWDLTPYTFTNSPLVQLPGGGPGIGIARVK
ncbi:hypothetical protein [Rhodococcus marinonascens]|uniref:hypothetical protein n=1 Tax=Rhodococcus marinonascens TaxID=38311 RepID=UPI000933B24A|nr:hypothetical protein [Rhodococcus marinonascens]